MLPSYHSICRWTFNPGKGGFVPAGIRPAWDQAVFDTPAFVKLVAERIVPRLPTWIQLGVELHYDSEICDRTAAEVAALLLRHKLHLAMITPGAHSRFGYGGLASLDPTERRLAAELGKQTVDLAYYPLRQAWHPEPQLAPTLVIWNGSFGYDLVSPLVQAQYRRLREGLAELCRHEQLRGGQLYIGIEPKPNEGHPALLLPTAASALLLWRQLESRYGIIRTRKGLNMEIGHSEMIGLDPVYDLVEQIEEEAVVHLHLNGQGATDGITMGGAGKFDIDMGVRINGSNIALASLLEKAGFTRWKGHDMQPRPYDTEEQAIDRVVRSILSWEACAQAARTLDINALEQCFVARQTASAEDMLRGAVVKACAEFEALYLASRTAR